MSLDLQAKVFKLFEVRSKLEGELKVAQQDLEAAILKGDRKVKVENAVKTCNECFAAANAKNNELLLMAKKTNEEEKLTKELEEWLDVTTRLNHVFLEDARKYIESLENVGSVSNGKEQSGAQSKKSSKIASSTSKTSSQRKRDLALAKMRREEVERQSEAALRLQEVKNRLALEEVEELNRQKVAQAKMDELELEIEANSNESSEVNSNRDLGVADEENRTEAWVNNTSRISQEPLVLNKVDENLLHVNGQGTVFNPVALPSTSEAVTDYESVLSSFPHVQPNPVSSLLSVPSVQLGTQSSNVPIRDFEVSNTVLPGRSPLHATSSLTICDPTVILNNITAPPVIPAAQPLHKTTSAPVRPAVNHFVPNLTPWSFPNAQPLTSSVSSSKVNATSSVPVRVTRSAPYSSGGTVYYVPPCTNPVQVSAPVNPSVVVEQPTSVPSAVQSSNFPGSAPVTISDLAQLLTISRRDPLPPEWKLESYDGNPLQWHEWFGQFRSAVDSAPLSADVKLTYLKSLVTGKAKTAIANFAYCGSMYQEALRTLERKFGQPQAVVGAYLEKLSNYPAVKMHSSDSIVSYASVITSLVSVFQSLSYEADLKSASLMNLAVSKLPPNMKEGWSLHTVKRNLLRPTLLDFNTWLQEKAEAHERMRTISKNASAEEQPSVGSKKTTSKVFASTTEQRKTTKVSTSQEPRKSVICLVCKANHPLWRCTVFKEKTPTQRAKLVAENQLQ